MASPTRLSAPASTLSAPAEKPWHAHITIDLLAHVLARSIFHPYIAWLVPLCLRSLSYPTSHPHFQYTCLYATFITLFAVLSKLNKRLAWGPPRKLDWEHEVVVITGGASGLGKVIAEMYGMRGVSVAVLDVRVPDEKERERSEALEHVRFYRCDVGRLEEVQRARGEIERDVRRTDSLIMHHDQSHQSTVKSHTTQHSRSVHPSIISCLVIQTKSIQSRPNQTTLQTSHHHHQLTPPPLSSALPQS
jgi:hypothetical protein